MHFERRVLSWRNNDPCDAELTLADKRLRRSHPVILSTALYKTVLKSTQSFLRELLARSTRLRTLMHRLSNSFGCRVLVARIFDMAFIISAFYSQVLCDSWVSGRSWSPELKFPRRLHAVPTWRVVLMERSASSPVAPQR